MAESSAEPRSPGPDGITLDEFIAWFRPRWDLIRRQLLDGTYRPSPVRRVTIDKPDGGTRQLGIPNVLDRVIQQAILQILTPVFDPHFSDSSHGFRPNRSAHGAMQQFGGRSEVAVLCRGYGPVEVLRQSQPRRADEPNRSSRFGLTAAERIGRYLRAGVIVDGELQPSTEGTPQGGPLSPLLANILLDDLDKELEQSGLPFVRYADDFVIFTKSERAAQRVFSSVQRYLIHHLRLVVNETKSKVVPWQELEFLGFCVRGRYLRIRLTDKSLQRFKRRVRELTGRSWGVSMERRLSELRSYLRGWAGYFSLAMELKLFDKLDQWIRRRIRMCFWKRWRHSRTRSRELMRLGVPRRQAIRHAKSRKGYWRMAKTIASGVGFTNAMLEAMGLLSLKSLWNELDPLRRTA
ncbi:MAG: group II intron reverse transcriptase/maturase [Planctomycetaceae bacterium]